MHTLNDQRLRILGALGLLCLTLLLSACGNAQLASTPTASQVSSGLGAMETILAPPKRLLIPAIHVNAPIESVSLASDGTLATPTQNPWADTGWYAGGPHPGGVGSAVIDGHLDRPGGAPAVFWDLRLLQPGDQVTIVDASGKIWHFRVDNVVAYQPQNAPLQQIFGDTGGHYLNLITCAGTWIPSQHQTTLRRVVYTSLMN